MSWWKKLFDVHDPPPVAEAAPVAAPAAVPTDVARLACVGKPDGPSIDEALVLLAGLRRTSHEARALNVLVMLSANTALPEPLAIAGAAALVDRGEAPSALRLLSGMTSPDALLVSADLRAELGEFATALALIERVLLRELDHPGARDRHRRWRAALGLGSAVARGDASAPTMVTSEPDAPYVLLREVGRGGAGAVYEAEDRELGRRLALKVYHDPVRNRAQLEHEAKVAVLLAGRGVLRVFDVDPAHGWISLEWAAHGSVRDRLRARDLAPLIPIERWALPLAVTLARIHAAGWVHLDVKPANVLLSAADAPLLADFGTARRAGEPASPGSLGYVSPERLAGRVCRPRDDVYGFGRLLEDVLQQAPSDEIHARWRALASACVAADEDRLTDAREIVTRIQTELRTV